MGLRCVGSISGTPIHSSAAHTRCTTSNQPDTTSSKNLKSAQSTTINDLATNFRDISWDSWTTSDYLNPQNQTSHSADPSLQHIDQSQTKTFSSISFKNWRDTNLEYRKLLYKGNDIYTPLPASQPFRLGTPLFISRDPKKRLIFWVRGDYDRPSRSRFEIVSPEFLRCGEGEWIPGSQIWEAFMGKEKVPTIARVVTWAELGRFHEERNKRGDI